MTTARRILLLCLLLLLALPALAGWEDSYLPQIRKGIADPESRPPPSLVFPTRQRQMSPNHDAMRIAEWYRSGDPAAVEPVRAWLRYQLTVAHMGPEQLSPTYSGLWEEPLAGIALTAFRRGDSETLWLVREWWRHHAALYWLLRTPDLRVLVAGARANRPWEWGMGAVLRALIGRSTPRDRAVIAGGPDSATPQLWAVSVAIAEGAVLRFRPRELEIVTPPLAYPLTVWREPRGLAMWSPVLESAGGSIPQWGALVVYGQPQRWGDPDGVNPRYLRGINRRTRKPQEAPVMPEWIPLALRLEAAGKAQRRELGKVDGNG